MKYVCTLCGWEYDEETGDPENGIEPGTAFEDLPEDFACPLCGAGKEDFEEALKDAIAMNIPCVLDCHIEKDDKVFPMVSPGASLMETFDC